jgi:hypothetical protein
MKRLILILLILIGSASIPQLTTAQHGRTKVEYVLICNSSNSYAYHAYECRGLAHCRHEISKVTKAQAIKLGYRPCKICYR